MPVTRQFPYAPAEVFAALSHAVRRVEKLRGADAMSREITFGTRASGWSWGSEWVIRVQGTGQSAVATADIRVTGSVVASMTEGKRIEALYDAAEGLLARHHASAPGSATKMALDGDAVALALAAGFPAKHQRLLEPILRSLAAAERHAAAREIVEEELAIVAAHRAAAAGGMFVQKPRAWVEEQIQTRMSDGRLRRGVEFLGRVGANTTVMSDRVLQGHTVHAMDDQVRASVEVGGQILQSTRPTLTRMAIGSVLPGSALLVGLAAPKDTTTDARTATFILAHPTWRILEPIDPDGAHDVASFAAQLNLVFAPKQTTAPTQHQTTSGELTVRSVADELTKLAALRDAGVLTPEEFAAAKARLLT